MRLFRQLVHRFQLHERWVLTAFLIVAVALPTVFFLYFLQRSIAGEGVVASAAATADLRNSLLNAQAELDLYIANLPGLRAPAEEEKLSPSEKFARAIERDVADSILIVVDRQPAYPLISHYRDPSLLSPVDLQALQFREEKRGLASFRTTPATQDWSKATDLSGRLILPTMQLLSLDSRNLTDAERQNLQSSLEARVRDYRPPVLPSAQRLFLVDEIRKFKSYLHFPYAQAEQIAIDILQNPLPALEPGVLTLAPKVLSPNPPHEPCWMILGDPGRIAVYTESRIFKPMRERIGNTAVGEGLGVRLQLAGLTRPREVLAQDIAGPRLPGYELQIYRSASMDSESSRKRIQRTFAVGAAVLAVIGLAGFFAIRRYLAVSRTTELRHDFLSTVSHELKTPLTSIRLLVETLCAGQYANPERTKQYAEVMQREIARLSHLVESFLTYTRLERGKLKFDFTETDPVQIAEHAIAIIGARFRGNCEFEVEIAEDLPLLEADSGTLITAILNLLDNAHKYSPDKKHIIFRVFAEKDHVYFSVTDSGIGLSQADCRRVLQRYYRVDSSDTRGIQGAGLGLSIVKNVAEAHEGELTVRSELGKGSTFTISIPVRNSPN